MAYINQEHCEKCGHETQHCDHKCQLCKATEVRELIDKWWNSMSIEEKLENMEKRVTALEQLRGRMIDGL